jgi:hypothetical protein
LAIYSNLAPKFYHRVFTQSEMCLTAVSISDPVQPRCSNLGDDARVGDESRSQRNTWAHFVKLPCSSLG